MIEWLVPAAPVLCALPYAVKPTARAARFAVTALGLFGVYLAGTVAVSIWALRNEFGDAPADKATIVAATISEAMNRAFFFVLVALVWAVPMFIGRRRRLARR